MMDIPLGLLRIDGIQLLSGRQGVQGADGKHLGLATGEESGTVDPGQQTDFGSQRTNLVHTTAVHTLAGKQPLLDDLLLHLVQADLDVGLEVLVLVSELVGEVHTGSGEPLLPDVLVVGVQGILDLVQAVGHQVVQQVVVHGGLLEGELGLADLGHNAVDELHDLHVGLVRDTDGFQHHTFGSLVGLGLDHNHLLEGGGDAHEAVGGGPLVGGGVDDILAVQVAHVGGGHGSVPGHIGGSNRDGSTQRGHDLHGIVVVIGQHGAGHDHVVAEFLVKEGPHGPVDDPAVQDAPLGGLALPAVEGAGDTAHGVHPLLKLDGQREIVDARLGQRGAGNGGQHHGIAVAAHTLGVGQLCHLAGLHGKGTAADHHFINLVIRELFVRNHW